MTDIFGGTPISTKKPEGDIFGGTPVKQTVEQPGDIFGGTPVEQPGDIFGGTPVSAISSSTPGYVPSETEKAKYGFAKEPWIGGSAWRLIQATTGMGVEGDTFAERRENAWNRHME